MFPLGLIGQTCDTGSSSPNTVTDWGSDYIPSEYDKPLTIQVIWHFVNFVDTLVNFTANTDGLSGANGISSIPEINGDSIASNMIQKLNDLAQAENEAFTINEALGYSVDAPDFNMQFELLEVKYPTGPPSTSNCMQSQGVDLNYINSLESDAIHVFFVTNPNYPTLLDTSYLDLGLAECDTVPLLKYQGCPYIGWFNLSRPNLVTVRNFWLHYQYYVAQYQNFGACYDVQAHLDWRLLECASLVWHEIGHMMGLNHVVKKNNGRVSDSGFQWNPPYSDYYLDSSINDHCSDTPPIDSVLVTFEGWHPADGDRHGGVTPDCKACGGTDLNLEQGVTPPPSNYTCSNNLMDYCRFESDGKSLTPQQLGRFFRTLYEDHFDAIKTDFCARDSACDLSITTGVDVEWNAKRIVRGNLTVESGATLTIKQHVYMPIDGRIIIHPGGRLVLDGGCITTKCDNLWAGIEVWGDAQSSQSPLSNQGLLEIKNDAVIENARCAVRLGHLENESPWTYDWSKTGGVIRAINSHFRNNRKDVEFLSYQHLNSANDEIANRSYFTNCDFVVDRLLSDQGSSIDDRVSLYKVNGVRFTSCTFSIEEEALAAYDLNTRSSGIRGKESGFVVNGKCNYTPPVGGECAPSDITAQTISESSGDVTPSVFRNLHYGVRANGPGSAASVQVSYSLFESNFRGVFLLAMSEPSLFRNRFIISDLNWQDDTEYGAMLSACTGYEVKRNYFEGHTNIAGHRHVGLWVSNSGGEPNEVYLNDFKDLHAGTIVMGRNRSADNDFIGLEVLCDLHDNTYFDIAVVKGKSVSGAVAMMQGQPSQNPLDFTAPAGNIFNNINYNNAENDYHIDQWSYPIIYQHHNANSSFNVVPWESDVNDVFKVPNEPQLTDRLQGCPKIPRLSPGVEKQRVLTHREEAEGISEDLHVLIDGGDTELLLQGVNDPFIESPALRNQLISASPFLSDSVLKAAIARSPAMNQWHLCEVLLANSPLQPDVFTYYETAAPLASYLHNLLVAYQGDELSARDQLSAELKEELRLKQHALGNYVRILLESDSLQERSEINTLLDQENDRAAMRRKFAYLRSSGQYQQAQQTLDSYEERPQDEVWKEVMDILLTIDAVGGYHAADSSHVALLLPLEASDKYGSAHASAVIENITGVDYEEALFYPSLSTKRLNAPVRNKASRPSLAGVYPNPANGEFFVTYVLPADRRDARVRVFDIQGSLILEDDITNGYGILPLNANRMSNGTYLMQLILNGEVVATEKFVIQK